MKKNISFFTMVIFALAFKSLIAQMNSLTPPDSVILDHPDQTIKYYYTYNSNGLLTEDKSIYFTNDEVTQSWRTLFEYDENNNKTVQLRQQQDSSGWSNYDKTEYSYNTNNDLILELYKTWHNSFSDWADERRLTIEYNSEGKPILETYEFNFLGWSIEHQNEIEYNENGLRAVVTRLDGFLGLLVYSQRDTFTYDSDDNLLEQIEYTFDAYSSEDSSSVPSKQYLHTYNNGMPETMTISLWEDSVWVPSEKTIYTYNESGSKTEETVQLIQDSAWVNSSQDTWVYNQLNKVEEYFTSYWISEAWDKDSGYVYEYDAEGNNIFQQVGNWENGAYNSEGLIDTLTLKISDDLEFIYSGTSFTAFFSDSTTSVYKSDSVPQEFKLEQNYPNPFNPTTTISFNLPEQGFVSLRVYNILGEEIAELVNKELRAGYHQVNFGSGNLSSGLYIYRLDVKAKFSAIKKMLLIK